MLCCGVIKLSVSTPHRHRAEVSLDSWTDTSRQDLAEILIQALLMSGLFYLYFFL